MICCIRPNEPQTFCLQKRDDDDYVIHLHGFFNLILQGETDMCIDCNDKMVEILESVRG